MENAELSLEERVNRVEQSLSQTADLLQIRDGALRHAIAATECGCGHVNVVEYATAFLAFLTG